MAEPADRRGGELHQGNLEFGGAQVQVIADLAALPENLSSIPLVVSIQTPAGVLLGQGLISPGSMLAVIPPATAAWVRGHVKKQQLWTPTPNGAPARPIGPIEAPQPRPQETEHKPER